MKGFKKSAVENESASTRQNSKNVEAIFQRCEVPNFYNAWVDLINDEWVTHRNCIHFNKTKNIAQTTVAHCLQTVAVSAILVNARS